MTIKAALHVHTTHSDGTLGLEEVLELYARLGFGFVAITDHDFLGASASRRQARAIRRPDLIVCPRIELTVFIKGYVHISRLEGPGEVLHVFNHPAQLNLPLPKVLERIAAAAVLYPLDAVELTSNGFPTPEFDVPELAYPKIATDDAHDAAGCGRAWIEVEAEPDVDSVLRAVKAGAFRNRYWTSGQPRGGLWTSS